jgi:hypothetical protein
VLLLDVVDGVLSKSGFRSDALVRATSTGPHTILRVTVPSAGVAVCKDDIIEYGLDIANSELGLRSVQSAARRPIVTRNARPANLRHRSPFSDPPPSSAGHQFPRGATASFALYNEDTFLACNLVCALLITSFRSPELIISWSLARWGSG